MNMQDWLQSWYLHINYIYILFVRDLCLNNSKCTKKRSVQWLL